MQFDRFGYPINELLPILADFVYPALIGLFLLAAALHFKRPALFYRTILSHLRARPIMTEAERQLFRKLLTGTRQAHQQPTAARKQLLRHQDSKGRSHRAADDADGLTTEQEGIEGGVVAGPALECLCLASVPEPANKVAVGIENAQARHIHDRQAFLAARLAQQCACREDGRRRLILVVQNGRQRPCEGTVFMTAAATRTA